MNIDRREALARVAAIMGTAVVGADFFLAGCARFDKRDVTPFTPAEIALFDEIADTIIPDTDSPGAKAAAVGAFMARLVQDCYSDDGHALVKRGLSQIDGDSRKHHGKAFLESTPAERTAFLNALDVEQRRHAREKTVDEPQHYFRFMKEITLLGYFTSEIGCTKAMRYVEAPGRYDGDVPYKPGDRAWVNPSRRS